MDLCTYTENKIIKILNDHKKIIILFLCFLTFCLFFKRNENKNIFPITRNEKIYFDKYEVYKFNEIKEKLEKSNCSQMWANQKEFLNGIIRKYKPKKILEIGVANGGSSIIILNAINDFRGSKLFSIDLNSGKHIGKCVEDYFPQFTKKWTLFRGDIATEFIEKIGNNIDMVLIDTAHFEPGEILDFLIVLPFLKKNAIIIFHDIANQITRSKIRNEWAPYLIFNGIRGKKYLPSGNYILKHDIGAIILDTNQYNYYNDYFRFLGGQWQYFPKKSHINKLRYFFKKYYDKECLVMFEEAVIFNRNFVKNNPKKIIYSYNSDK